MITICLIRSWRMFSVAYFAVEQKLPNSAMSIVQGIVTGHTTACEQPDQSSNRRCNRKRPSQGKIYRVNSIKVFPYVAQFTSISCFVGFLDDHQQFPCTVFSHGQMCVCVTLSHVPMIEENMKVLVLEQNFDCNSGSTFFIKLINSYKRWCNP